MITEQEVKEKTEERFWSKIKFGEPNECWLWLNGKKRYGNYKYQNKKIDAHKFMFVAMNGEIEKGICVLHQCDNGRCVNPNHLFAGTHSENMKDMVDKNRVRHGSDSPFAKLNEEQVNECYRRMHDKENPETTRALAKEFGVGKTIMGKIRKGEKWKRALQIT